MEAKKSLGKPVPPSQGNNLQYCAQALLLTNENGLKGQI